LKTLDESREPVIPTDDVSALLTRYLPILSHDVRTPMTAIRGATGLLSAGVAGRLSDHQQKLVDICHRNADLTTLLVQDVVDLLRLGTGTVRVQPIDLDALAEAREMWDMVSAQTALPVEILSAEGRVPLHADRNYLRRAISALIRFPQGHGGVERASLTVRSVADGVEMTLYCTPLSEDVDWSRHLTVRCRRQIKERLSVTGLEIDLLGAIAAYFSAELSVLPLPGEALQITMLWPAISM